MSIDIITKNKLYNILSNKVKLANKIKERFE